MKKKHKRSRTKKKRNFRIALWLVPIVKNCYKSYNNFRAFGNLVLIYLYMHFCTISILHKLNGDF